MYRLTGIIPVGSTVRDDYPLVQSRCHYDILDVYSLAKLVQDYYSTAQVYRNVEYIFPLPPSAAVSSFKAIINETKVIQGVVKEREEAKQEFKEAVAQGTTAGLLQQEHADVFRVSLGNIGPKQRITVHISFVSIVPHDGDSPHSLRTTMPTAIAPRYGVPPPGVSWFDRIESRIRGSRFELTAAIQMDKPITSVASPSHRISTTLGSAERELKGEFEPSKAFVYLTESAFLDKDIVVVISAQGLDIPRCCVERWLSSEGAEETTDAYALTLVPKFNLLPLPSQEYLFLVDRSGSMAGGRIAAVKTSLQIMLRSLPSHNTKFNIISFGSHHNSLWPGSQEYSEETVAEASRHIDTFAANYGGTELRAALGFVFKSRLAVNDLSSSESPPTSILILTDGEAWDLQGVVELVTENVETAKTEGKLLRTFVLGIGNQVSMAMCEGIARAGKGTAVFVPTGEKPDAKLMTLLKAARGAVIEDLIVDWGIKEPEKINDDDFELVSGPSEEGTPAPQSQLPPINLFTEATPSDDDTEIGPKKSFVQLPPPPILQQAPVTDKLPIPLYPGFRCSIFAIVKQLSNPGPSSTSIRITGKVLGREVTFETPVSPRAIGSSVASKVTGGTLLHTLAAKALIQLYEDKSSSPETRAHIERLGKRYSLASSMTSFLAIDKESSTVIGHKGEYYQLQELSPTASSGGIGASLLSPSKQTTWGPRPQFHRTKHRKESGASFSVNTAEAHIPQSATWSQQQQPAYGITDTNADHNSLSFTLFESPTQEAYQSMYATASSMSDAYYDPTTCELGRQEEYSVRHPAPDRLHQLSIDSLTTLKKSLLSSHVSSGPEGGESSHTPSAPLLRPVGSVIYTETAGPPPQRPETDKPTLGSTAPVATLESIVRVHAQKFNGPEGGRSSHVPPMPPLQPVGSGVYTETTGSPLPIPMMEKPALSLTTPVTTFGSILHGQKFNGGFPKVVTLESIVRGQKFNGSFPKEEGFLRWICGHRAVPEMPDLLCNLEAEGATVEGVKMEIWATALVVAYLRRSFAAENDTWGMVAEKAMVFIKESLEGIDARYGDLGEALVGDAEKRL